VPKKSGAKPVPYREAIALAGSEERLRTGANPSTAANWKRRGVPWDVLGPIVRERFHQDQRAGAVAERTARYGDAHLDAEWRQTHTYTAMVTALRRLEALYPLGSKSPNAWRVRVAWEAMLAGASTLLAVANWKDEDWKRIFDDGADLWKRPKAGKRSEAETLRERLQIELGFTKEGEG